jgi:hypothetical protein
MGSFLIGHSLYIVMNEILKALSQLWPVKQQESGTSNSNSDVKTGKEDKKLPLKYCVFIANHPFITFGKWSIQNFMQ